MSDVWGYIFVVYVHANLSLPNLEMLRGLFLASDVKRVMCIIESP